MFNILSEDDSSNARIGKLETRTGSYETPFFMPVATKGNVKLLPIWELTQLNVQSIISNSLVLYLRPGLDVITNFGGLHNYIGWNRSIFTDSGGFQVLSFQSILEGITDKGMYFRSPFDGSRHFLNPEKSMDIQLTLGSDVAMMLDHMPLFTYNERETIEATRRTHLWARIAKTYHEKHNDIDQLLFGIAQGGFIKELRIKSAKFIDSLDFDGIALGGLRIGEPRELTERMINVSMPYFSKEKPKYLMGVGHVVDILFAVEHGIDIFDSVYPTRTARHGQVLSFSDGAYNIKNSKYSNDDSPLDENCKCKVCRKLTRSFIHHLYKTNEHTAKIYLTYHNIAFMMRFMKEIRNAIKHNYFQEFKKEMLEKFAKQK